MLKIKTSIGGKIKGLIVSNELPDTFPVHKIKQTENGAVKVCVCIPLLERTILKELSSILSNLNSAELEKSHKENFAVLEEILTNQATRELHDKTASNAPYSNMQKYCILDGQQWLSIKKKLHALNKENNQRIKPLIEKFDNATYFLEIYVDHENFPEIQPYLQRNKSMLPFLPQVDLKDELAKSVIAHKHLPVQTRAWFINNRTEDYLKAVSIILDCGFHMLIDYGSNWSVPVEQLSFPFYALRLYPNQPQTVDDYILLRAMYGNAGHFDITSDVNFGDLILCSNTVGLKTQFYGKETNLAGVRIKVSKTNLIDRFDLDSPVFSQRIQSQKFPATGSKMIIQSKVSSNNIFVLLTQSEDPFPNIEKRIKKPKLSDLLKTCMRNPDRDLAKSENIFMQAIDAIDSLDQEDLSLIEHYHDENPFDGCVDIIIPVIQRLKKKGLIANNLFVRKPAVTISEFDQAALLAQLLGSMEDGKENTNTKGRASNSTAKAGCANPGCSKTDNLKNCSRCKQVQYCSRECQAAHWKNGHKGCCKAN
jgi:hypothetical protein